MQANSLWRVCKFGGTSVANAACLQRAMAIVRKTESPGIVVVSAMGGVTNRLIEAAEQAVLGNLDPANATAADLRKRHEDLVDELFGAHENQSMVLALKHKIHSSVKEFEHICASLAVLGERTPRIMDVVVSRGERLLAQIFAQAMLATDSGSSTFYVDATEVLFVTLGGPEGGEYISLDMKKTVAALEQKVLPALRQGATVVIPGFIATGAMGQIVTLGRGGSDYSATLLAGLLHASQVTLYKEVDGLLTADPKFVPDARVIKELHYREATELAFYGAKVLHPRTIIPLMADGIPLVIKNSFRPEFPGTRISADAPMGDFPVKALTAVSSQALITVQGNGMMGVPGIAGRTFSALAQAGLSTSFISQASSESSICFVVPELEVEPALEVLRQTFKMERCHGLIEDIYCKKGIAVAAVVGYGMKGHAGVAARTMLAISEAGANIIAIAQGSSELNISVAIEERDREAVLRSLHREYRLHEMTLRPERRIHQSNLFLYGFGQIGRTLAHQVKSQRDYFLDALSLDLRTVAAADKLHFRFAAGGIPEGEMVGIMHLKGQTGRLISSPVHNFVSEFKEHAADSMIATNSQCHGRNIFVDCTDAETLPLLLSAVEAGMSLVLANKKPLAVPQSDYDRLFELAAVRGVAIRFEATVGAGLPVLDTLAKLLSAGDEIFSIEGCLSGTLGFLMTQVCAGQLFSEAVREAFAKGYTEPDPREDLGGLDVARKALILARTLGSRLNLEGIALEPLCPPGIEARDNEELFLKLRVYDLEMARHVTQAAQENCVLRYVASIINPSTPQVRLSVGLRQVPADSAMGMLRGTDNQVVIRSRRYDTNPLVVTGPGAGSEVTAAGVLNDIVALSQMENLAGGPGQRRIRA